MFLFMLEGKIEKQCGLPHFRPFFLELGSTTETKAT